MCWLCPGCAVPYSAPDRAHHKGNRSWSDTARLWLETSAQPKILNKDYHKPFGYIFSKASLGRK